MRMLDIKVSIDLDDHAFESKETYINAMKEYISMKFQTKNHVESAQNYMAGESDM
jgi:hypothetical protein